MTQASIITKPSTCATCDGKRFLFVVNAEFPDDPPVRMPCGTCAATGLDSVELRPDGDAYAAPYGMPDHDQEAIHAERARAGIVDSFVRVSAVIPTDPITGKRLDQQTKEKD